MIELPDSASIGQVLWTAFVGLVFYGLGRSSPRNHQHSDEEIDAMHQRRIRGPIKNHEDFWDHDEESRR